MKKNIYFNGRFLTKPMSGVQRVAYEMLLAIDNLIGQQQIRNQFNFQIIYSGTIVNPIQLKNIKLLRRGISTGNLWEQFELPFYTAGGLLISLCSISTLFKRKQILVIHDASFWANPGFFDPVFVKWYNFAIPFIAKICRQVVTVSNFSKTELVKYGKLNPAKITVIYNAAEHILKYDEPAEDFKLKIIALKPYCLAVSSLAANKNFKGLADAIRQIDFSDYHMLIAGGEMSTLKYAPPKDKTVNYLGYVDNNELKYLYANAALFISPSFYEGFGIPPLEAMILKCPVIASNTSALPEILGNNCSYFNPYDIADMARNIANLLSHPAKMDELVQKGYHQALKYGWDKSAAAMFTLIQKFS